MSHPHKRHLLLELLSLTLLAAGIATVGYSGYRVWSDNQVDGVAYLPAINHPWSDYIKALSPVAAPPAEGSYLGTISIPSLGRTIKIYEGTTEATLAKGVGHFRQSVMPGAADNSVLAGHRDTVFTHLGKVKIGEEITITTKDGTFIYRVTRTRIVKANDKTVIVPTKYASLTISTCYPFLYFGSAPDRFIISAELIVRI